MSLSDRLQQARTRRLIEAGVLPSEFALKPEAEVRASSPVEAELQGLFAPIKIEVQPTGLHLVAETPHDLTELPQGKFTSNCPNCNAIGHLDMVDLVGHTKHLTCDACGTMWQQRHSDDETITR